MAVSEIVFRKSVARDLRTIPKQDVARILQRIEALRDDPRPPGCEKLTGSDRYRIRQGVYRILYEIRSAREGLTLTIIVVKVGHRSRVYRSS